MKALRVLAGIICGVGVTLLLFPFGGTTGCADGTHDSYCKSWIDTMLFQYEGENSAPWMLVALAAGFVVGPGVYFSLKGIAKMRARRRDTATSDSNAG